MRDSVVHGIDLVDPLDLHQLVMDRFSPRAASLPSHGASRETWDDSAHRMTHFDTPDPMRTEPPAGNTAATEWDRTAVQRALDELFQFALQYDSCQEFQDLMRFIGIRPESCRN